MVNIESRCVTMNKYRTSTDNRELCKRMLVNSQYWEPACDDQQVPTKFRLSRGVWNNTCKSSILKADLWRLTSTGQEPAFQSCSEWMIRACGWSVLNISVLASVKIVSECFVWKNNELLSKARTFSRLQDSAVFAVRSLSGRIRLYQVLKN